MLRALCNTSQMRVSERHRKIPIKLCVCRCYEREILYIFFENFTNLPQYDSVNALQKDENLCATWWLSGCHKITFSLLWSLSLTLFSLSFHFFKIYYFTFLHFFWMVLACMGNLMSIIIFDIKNKKKRKNTKKIKFLKFLWH